MALSLEQFAAQFPTPMAKGIATALTNEGVFMRLLKFTPVDGFSYQYGEEVSLGGIAYRGLNEDYPAGEYGVINPKTETLAIFGGEIRTDMQIVNKQGAAARANEIARRMRRASLFFDREVIKGAGKTNPKAIKGLYDRLVGKQLMKAGNNGGSLTLAMVDDLIDRVYGTPQQKVLLMNKAVRRQLKELLSEAAGGATFADVASGVTSYDGVKIEILDEDGDEEAILDFDEACGTSNVTTSILCIHPGSTTDGEGMQGLIGSKMIEHNDAGCQGTKWLDVVECHAGFALFNGRSAARLQGILAA